MVNAESFFNLVSNLVGDPRHRSRAGYFVVNFDLFNFKCLKFGGVKIDLLFWQTVNVGIVNLYHKSVLGLGLVFYPNFCEGMQATQGNCKREKRISLAAPLLGADNMLTYLEFGKLGQRVEQHRHANIFTFTQETEFGAFLCSLHTERNG